MTRGALLKIAVLPVLLLPGLSLAQQKPPSRKAATAPRPLRDRDIQAVQRAVDDLLKANKVPGGAWAVAYRDRSILGAGGEIDVENRVRAWPDAVFRLGSISKPVTATAVLQLAERGKLDLDAPIQRYCLTYPEKRWTVTPRQLLAHLGGIRNYRSSAEFFDTRTFESPTAAVAIIRDDELMQEPGTKYSYSSYGYNLLGCAIEGASGMGYMQYLRANVLEPAHMENTRAEALSEIVRGRASGYRLNGDHLERATHVDTSSKLPGGGLLGSSADLLRFALALQDGRLLKQESFEAMSREQQTTASEKVGYALGWRVAQHNGREEVYHGGEASGFSGILYLIPKERFAFALLTNRERLGDERLALARRVAEIVTAHTVPQK